jgi:outer membrane protein OmpU
MKKLLIATTALVATAGFAAAEITFSGGARFGVVHTGKIAAGAATVGVLDELGESTATADVNSTGGGSAGAEGDESNSADVAIIEEARLAAAGDQAALDSAAASFLASDDSTAAKDAREDASDNEELVAALTASQAAAAGAAGSAAKKSKNDVYNRITFNIDGSVVTDTGVEFFGKVRIRGGNKGDGATAASTISAPRVGVNVGSLTVAVGNINGAVDSTAGIYAGTVGLTGLGYSNLVVGGFDGFSSGGGGSNGVEVIYSMNGLGMHLSHSKLAAGDRTAVALTYAFGDWSVGLAHQSADLVVEEFTMVRVDGKIGDLTLGAAFGDNDVSIGDQFRVNAGFSVGAGTDITVYVKDTDLVGAETAFGVGFTHSLGGATLAGGVAENAKGNTVADLGVRFNF